MARHARPVARTTRGRLSLLTVLTSSSAIRSTILLLPRSGADELSCIFLQIFLKFRLREDVKNISRI